MTPLLSRKWVWVVFLVLILGQVALNGFAASAILLGLRNMVLFDIGAILVRFGVIVHLYRYSQNLPVLGPQRDVARPSRATSVRPP